MFVGERQRPPVYLTLENDLEFFDGRSRCVEKTLKSWLEWLFESGSSARNNNMWYSGVAD